MKNPMCAVYVSMTGNIQGDSKRPWSLDQEAWDSILLHAVKNGYNTILLDVCDGLTWKSHPEISIEGAWSHEKMKAEIKKAAAMGITIIPKLNFSTNHDVWLGEYSRMVSTSIYYGVCRDLINEICEVFDSPEYVHIGMDEESYVMAGYLNFVCYRQHDLLWHDLRFFIDCVKDNGATPWMWADFMIYHPEEFRAHIKPDEILLSPWQYFAMYEENFSPITRTEADYKWYTTGVYKNSGIKYVEEDPLCLKYRQEVIPAMNDGYNVVPTTSYYFKCECNHDDTVRWFSEKAPKERIAGFMDAAWIDTTKENLSEILEGMDRLAAARKKYNL